ncbi:T9SS type A sorting domain-containing protein [candidate division KSB1 bacterium]|nr:T9SS type A sorting domain-containing protein [candidate division KSB1 bacterium]
MKSDTSKISFGVAFSLFVFCGLAYSQNWVNYSEPHGLSSYFISAIVEDNHTNIWVGTDKGVNRFDGREWTIYSRVKGEAIIDDDIKTIAKDREGNLWIGTANGLSKIDPESDLRDPQSWKNYDSDNTKGGLVTNLITAVLEDSSGNIWVACFRGGLSIANPKPRLGQDPLLDPKNWTIVKSTTDQLPSLRIFALEKDNNSNIWIGTSAGASRYNPHEHTLDGKWDLKPALGNVRSIFADSYGYVWFGRAGKGVARVLATPPFLIEEFPFAINAEKIGEDSDRKIWLGTTDDGIFVVDPQALADSTLHFTQQTSRLSDDAIRAIFRDSESDMWIGTGNEGISRYDISWINFSRDPARPFDLTFNSAVIPTIIEDDSRHLWLGTDGEGLRRINLTSNLLLDNNWTAHRKEDQDKTLSSNHINTIFQDDTGKIWVGTTPEDDQYKGLNVIKPPFSDLKNSNNWDTFTAEEGGLADNTVNTIAQDRSRYLWFGTENGLSRVHVDSAKFIPSWKTFTTADSLADTSIQALLVDDGSRLWIGTNAGLNWTNPTASATIKFERIAAVKGFVQAIFQDRDGNLWFGTNRNGVYKINAASDTTTLINFTTANGLASNSVRAIVQQRPNEYWFATGSGLTRLRVSGVDSLWTTFKAEDGLQDLSVFEAFKDSKGDLWFGTASNGVTRHRVKPQPPETFMTSKLDVTTANNVIMSFRGVDRNTSPPMFRYSFRFDNGAWSPFLTSEQVPIFGLTLGRHVFDVRAADMDGNIDSTFATDVFYKIAARLGGKVEFQDSRGRIALYLSPEKVETVKEIKINRVENYVLKDSLSILAYDIQPEALTLDKPATLTVAFKDTLGYRQNKLAIFRQGKNSEWIGIGGVVKVENDTLTSLTTAITEFGRYAVRRENIAGIGRTAISDVNIQPRIFSPAGGGQGHGDRAGISFHLSNNAGVTVKIYNVAGRLKRTLRENVSLQVGTNAIEWDGRDDDGKVCVSGLYIVTIEAQGNVKTKTVAVLNK